MRRSAGIRLARGQLAVQPRGLLFFVPALEYSWTPASNREAGIVMNPRPGLGSDRTRLRVPSLRCEQCIAAGDELVVAGLHIFRQTGGRILRPRMSSATVLLFTSKASDKARVAAALGAIRGQAVPARGRVVLADGLARLKHGRLDAILLDLNLPDSTGVTTFLRIQPKATQYPIVALVGDDDEDIGADVSRAARSIPRRDDQMSHLIDKVLRYATERTHTLLALKASEQRYRELFQNVTAGVFQTTPDGKFMAANPALVRMLGYDSEDELLELDVARDIYMDRRSTATTGQDDGRAAARCAMPSCC